MEITKTPDTNEYTAFLDLLKQFVSACKECFCDNKGMSKKKRKAFKNYIDLLDSTKLDSPSLKKLIEGCESFFQRYDYLLFSPEADITKINTPIFYSDVKVIYIPVDIFISSHPQDKQPIYEFLMNLSLIIEQNPERKLEKKKFIFSQKFFGLKIDDNTTEGAFMCRWIAKAQEFMPLTDFFSEAMSCKDINSIVPMMMGLFTSGKLTSFTEEMRQDWVNSGIGLPNLMRRMADVIEGMSVDINSLSKGAGCSNINFGELDPNASRILPDLLRSTSDDVENS